MARHLYIHVPFCNYICTFCDFKRDLIYGHDVAAFVDKLIAGLKGPYDTVYLGGGTPNALPDAELRRLLMAIKPTLADDYELTVESNPDSVTANQAKTMKECGVNRVSLGAQTTNDSILALTNRHHTTAQTETAVRILKDAGIANLSLDFIYNLPFLKDKDVADAVDLCVRNGVDHVSFYALELKEGSVMTKKGVVRIDELIEERQLLLVSDLLKKQGYERYEVSNWAKRGVRSRHNVAYWQTDDWQALGYGAWGMEGRTSYRFEGAIADWQLVEETLSDHDYHFQVVMMGLRLVEGMDLAVPKNKAAYDYFGDRLSRNVRVVGNRLVCDDVNVLHETLLPLL